MDDNVYDIEDYYRILNLQKKYENDEINEDDLSSKEIDSLIELYKYQIKDINDKNRKILLDRKD